MMLEELLMVGNCFERRSTARRDPASKGTMSELMHIRSMHYAGLVSI